MKFIFKMHSIFRCGPLIMIMIVIMMWAPQRILLALPCEKGHIHLDIEYSIV